MTGRRTCVFGGLLLSALGFGLPPVSYGITGCSNANLTGTYTAQVSSLNFTSVLNALNGSAGGSGSTGGASGTSGASGASGGGTTGGGTGGATNRGSLGSAGSGRSRVGIDGGGRIPGQNSEA